VSKRVVVIGGGPAGVEAAVQAATAGAGVTLVSDMPPGGRSAEASLLPSKVFLHAAELRALRGATGRASDAELAAIRSDVELHQKLVVERAARRLDDAGVRLVRGVARFGSPHEVLVSREGKDEKKLALDAAVVATGSGPFFPPGFLGEAKMPDGEVVLAPRALKALSSVPRTILVIGGGATGAEAAHLFQRLGSDVTWIVDELGILPSFDRDLSEVLGGVLVERGVKLVSGKRVTSVTVRREDPAHAALAALDGGRTYGAERAFVAIGRRADLSRLGLEAAGLSAPLVVDAWGRTTVPHLFAAGDATGEPCLEGRAVAQGWTAGRAAAGLEVPPLDPSSLVHAVYTEPELAKVGLSPAEAVGTGRAVKVATCALGSVLRGQLEGVGIDRHRPGQLRIAVAADGQVVGASAIGPRAAELLAPLAVAMRARVPVQTLAATFVASPTLHEAIGAALR
jgi:dihydrolipoamide dehydrogenase